MTPTKALAAGILGTLIGASALPCCAAANPSRKWSAPEIRGLQLGVADEVAVRAKLGEPVYAGDEEPEPYSSSSPRYILQYPVGKDDGGFPTFAFDRKGGTLVAVELYPRAMTLEQAIERFGANGIKRAQDAGPCPPTPAEATQPVERFTGWLVYPSQGLNLYVRHDGSVQQIEYRASCP